MTNEICLRNGLSYPGMDRANMSCPEESSNLLLQDFSSGLPTSDVNDDILAGRDYLKKIGKQDRHITARNFSDMGASPNGYVNYLFNFGDSHATLGEQAARATALPALILGALISITLGTLAYSCGGNGTATNGKDDGGKDAGDGNLEPQCDSHAERRCYNDDVYWFDSCGTREGRAEDCRANEYCSNGQCVEEEPICIDNDHDNYGTGCALGPDCNDNNRNIHPGAEELCDSLDNNCNNQTDEGCACTNGETQRCGTTDVGECEYGTQICDVYGVWGSCQGGVEPGIEICDGLDNDCDNEPRCEERGILGDVDGDGSITDNDVDLTAKYALGMINNLTPEQIRRANANYCIPDQEEINVDDAILIAKRVSGLIEDFPCNWGDCERHVDEDLTPPYRECTVGVGECVNSGLEIKICQGESGWSSDYSCLAIPRQPSEEVCDGLDNDCDNEPRCEERGILGDVNGDGSITNSDAILVTQYIVGGTDLTPEQIRRANVNYCLPGHEEININDVVLILNRSQGLMEDFPCNWGDCENHVDEDLTPPYRECTAGVGECAKSGLEIKICQGESGWSSDYSCLAIPGQPSEEVCDGLDNDCDNEPRCEERGILGDVNGDGSITNSDATLVTQYIVGGTDLTPEQIRRANVNYCLPGHEEININDVVLILNRSQGLMEDFPCNWGDCENHVDEDLTPPYQECTAGVGECARSGLEIKICQGESGWSSDYSCLAIPGQPSEEVCDGLDNDCNGQIDEGNVCHPVCIDNDGDGYGTNCALGPDCNDNNGNIHPGASETCNGVDDNCNGSVDEGLLRHYYRDFDGDGYGNPSDTTQACTRPAGYVNNSGDCDDRNSGVNPAARELCDEINNDCDSQTDEGCFCTDGQTQQCGPETDRGECEYGTQTCTNGQWGSCQGAVYSSNETCDNKDNDCDGTIDEGVLRTFYQDRDGDGFGSLSATIEACFAPGGYVANTTDCNDNNPNIHPRASEICNGVDDNCNGSVDEGLLINYYRDADGDDYGVSSTEISRCQRPAGYAARAGDCDDQNRNINPAAEEVCDNIDNNCAGGVDEGGVCGPVCQDDRFEPNNTMANATELHQGTLENLMICDNDDWYRVWTGAMQRLTVNIDFSHANGDLDMELYDDTGNRVDVSEGTGNRETVEFMPTNRNMWLYTKVYGYGGADNSYSATASVENCECAGAQEGECDWCMTMRCDGCYWLTEDCLQGDQDYNEPNNSLRSATHLGGVTDAVGGGDSFRQGLGFLLPYDSDVDWFAISVGDLTGGEWTVGNNYLIVDVEGRKVITEAYYACDNGTTEVNCPADTSPRSESGYPGCAILYYELGTYNPRPAELVVNCAGTMDDSGTLYVKARIDPEWLGWTTLCSEKGVSSIRVQPD